MSILNKNFARHESFPLRIGWLRKGFDCIRKNPLFFLEENAADELGVGKNMLNAIKFWCQAFDIIQQTANGYIITDFARFLFEVDQFLEDPFSDWLLHYRLVSNKTIAPSFYWFFNEFNYYEFNSELFCKTITQKFITQNIKPPKLSVLQKEFNILILSYNYKNNPKDSINEINLCPLQSLNLINKNERNENYRFVNSSPFNVPVELIAYTIAKQITQESKNQIKNNFYQIGIDSILHKPLSPGKIFKFSKESLIEILEQISHRNLFGYSEYSVSAGIEQFVIMNQKLNPDSILSEYYKNESTCL